VLFQILLFFRFLQLDNERLKLEGQLAQLEADRVALAAVSLDINAVGGSLEPLLATLSQMPSFLRQQILLIEARRSAFLTDPNCTQGVNCPAQTPIQAEVAQIGEVPQGFITPLSELMPSGSPTAFSSYSDSECSEAVIESNATPVFATTRTASASESQGAVNALQAMQGPSEVDLSSYDDFGADMLVSYLDGLPPEDQAVLRTGEPAERYTELVEGIVNGVAVPALFAGLNARKDRIVQTSFTSAQQQLCITLEDNRDSIERHGLTTDGILDRIDAVKRDLLAHQIAPPADPSWWRLYPGKEATAFEEGIVVSEFSNDILASDAAYEAVVREIATLIGTISEQKSSIDSRIAETESQFDQARATFDQIAAPLPWVPIELRYAVLYYPLILAGVFCYFVVRYISDRERARSIIKRATAMDISPTVLDLYFSDYSISIVNAGPPARWNGMGLRPLVAVPLLLPGIAFIASIAMIVNSRGFVDDRTWYLALYAISAVCVVIGYWQLLLALRKPVAS
jgi:hypothetical protein